jgi:hypothetical protein
MRITIAMRKADDCSVTVDYDEDTGVSGTYWVKSIIETNNGAPIEHTKVFTSETAWSDAERYANDKLRLLGLDYTSSIQL